ncbi:MAG TPA: (2Fe-2S)-binding protein [Vicinamibacterales bacterium]|nr:(2Fe-2S)-binding protein [Vicinamibacterales bacterium]
MIVCICRGASEKQVANAIDKGASTLRDLQRCGIGDQCGSCHNALRMMLTEAASAAACPACTAEPAAAVSVRA